MVKRASSVGGPPFEYQAHCRKSKATILKYRRIGIAIVGCVFMGGVLLEGVCMVGGDSGGGHRGGDIFELAAARLAHLGVVSSLVVLLYHFRGGSPLDPPRKVTTHN